MEAPALLTGRPVAVVGTIVRPVLPHPQDSPSAAPLPSTALLRSKGQPSTIQLQLPTRWSGLRGGETICVKGIVRKPRYSGSSPTVQVDHVENVRAATNVERLAARTVGTLRQLLYDVLCAIYRPRTLGYVLALLLGDRRLLPSTIYEALQWTGTFHFLAISGLHVALVMWAVLRIPIPRRARFLFRILFLSVFCVLTGGNPPVLRAALLFGLHLFCERAGHRPRALNTLGWTGLLILCWDPRLIEDIGFQMSFAAAIAIPTWGQRLASNVHRETIATAVVEAARQYRITSPVREVLTEWRRGLWRVLLQLVGVAIAASVGTSPLLLFHFGRLHPLAPVWNLVAYPLTLAALLSGLASLLLGCVHPLCAAPFAALVELLVDAMVNVLKWAAELPGSVVFLPFPSVGATILSYTALISAHVLSRTRAFILAMTLLLVSCCLGFSSQTDPSVTLISTGTITSAVVRSGQDTSLVVVRSRRAFRLSDAPRLAQRLREHDVSRIARVVVLDWNWLGLPLPDLCKDLYVPEVWVPFVQSTAPFSEAVRRQLREQTVQIRELVPGYRYRLQSTTFAGRNGLELDVIHPSFHSEPPSVMPFVSVEVKGRRVLLTRRLTKLAAVIQSRFARPVDGLVTSGSLPRGALRDVYLQAMRPRAILSDTPERSRTLRWHPYGRTPMLSTADHSRLRLIWRPGSWQVEVTR